MKKLRLGNIKYKFAWASFKTRKWYVFRFSLTLPILFIRYLSFVRLLFSFFLSFFRILSFFLSCTSFIRVLFSFFPLFFFLFFSFFLSFFIFKHTFFFSPHGRWHWEYVDRISWRGVGPGLPGYDLPSRLGL